MLRYVVDKGEVSLQSPNMEHKASAHLMSYTCNDLVTDALSSICKTVGTYIHIAVF